MKKLISLIAIIFLLAGCVAQYKTLKIGEVNKNDKSITVPGVGNALFEIKSALLADGWKVKIDNASLHEKYWVPGRP